MRAGSRDQNGQNLTFYESTSKCGTLKKIKSIAVNFFEKQQHIFCSPYVLIQICEITLKPPNFNPVNYLLWSRVNKILLDTENIDHKD